MKIKLSWKRKTINIVVLVLALLCIMVGIACAYFESMLSKINYEQVSMQNVEEIIAQGEEDFDFGNLSDGTLYHDSQVLNIMLLSLDNYQSGDRGRSDSMMMVSIDKRNKEIKLTSFMRDLLIDIPGYGYDRLNAAYTYGGPSLTLAALENSFRVDIDRYVLIDFERFAEIIDTLGGVDIEITQDEAYIINAESGETAAPPVSAGLAHMTGKQARMYARIRKIDSDFQRTKRQRIVMETVINKMKSAGPLDLNNYLNAILPLITTDMSKDEVLGLASGMLEYVNYDIRSARVPANGSYYGEAVSLYGSSASVLVPNLSQSVEDLAKYVYGEDNLPSIDETFILPQYGGIYQGVDSSSGIEDQDDATNNVMDNNDNEQLIMNNE